jgi:uncharacterized protein YdeI (YjbR/CyaY-like superfamily)
MKDKRVDEYIASRAPFAQEILIKLREWVHKACPEVTETIKWGAPAFEYKGPMVMMAGFKAHCAFVFHKAPLMKDAELLKEKEDEAMGHLGKIRTLKDLPPQKVIAAYIKEAMQINDAGKKVKVNRVRAEDIEVPEDLLKALKKNRNAKVTFEAFSPSHKKEYVEWITEAKTQPTRDKRLATTIEWLEEGKSRNWKYQR